MRAGFDSRPRSWQAARLSRDVQTQGPKRVPKIDLGVKQLCPSCGAKFYDLHKRPAQCPKCGNVFDPDDETVKAKRARVARAPAAFDPALDEEDEEAAAKI